MPRKDKITPSLFADTHWEPPEEEEGIFQLPTITRKSLLYRTGVESYDWAMNHVQGCMHGCRFPCFAYMMSKSYKRVKNYKEWLEPKIVQNTVPLLKKEIRMNRHRIESIHLSFMTDAFMYDYHRGDLVEDIKNLSLRCIEIINKEGIRASVLTKGFYPHQILNKNFSKQNRYGITIISLNDDFHRVFEPFCPPYQQRIESLERLSRAGYFTWAIMEPYPTPNIDPTAWDVEKILNKIKWVNKLYFGQWNYNSLPDRFKGKTQFYDEVSRKVISFCIKHNIPLSIKAGTTDENLFLEKERL